MRPVLVLRPEPGAAATIARAGATGLEAIAAPIFTLAPLPWTALDPDDHDALMLTSANAVRHAGPDLHLYRALPVYAVGEATAAAATQAGFGPVISGPGDAAALVARMREDGVKRPLHLAGREHRAIDDAPFIIARCVVYAAEPVDTLPAAAAAALARDAVALIHSPRAAIVFAELLAAAGIQPESVAIAAISRAASAGRWREAAIAPTPDDSALLAAAARLCEKA